MKNSLIISAALAVVFFLGGCAGQKELACYWRGHDVVADGIDKEWPESPQYYDKDQRITVRVINNDKTLSLMVSSGSRSLQRQLQMAGLTVWFDPKGGTEQVFGLHLPAENMQPNRAPGDGGFGPRFPHSPPAENNTAEPDLRPPVMSKRIEELEITYSDTTGPLRMRMDEVRSTGIDVGREQTDEGRLVYEFNINFNAAPSLEKLKPGMLLGVGILTDSWAGQFGGPGPGGPSGMGGPPGAQLTPSLPLNGMAGPGGGMGGPGMGSNGPGHGGGRTKSLEIWLKVRLAGPENDRL